MLLTGLESVSKCSPAMCACCRVRDVIVGGIVPVLWSVSFVSCVGPKRGRPVLGRRTDWIIIIRDGSMVGFRVVGDVVLIMMVVIDIRRGRCDNGGVVVVEGFTSRVIPPLNGIIGIIISVRGGLITRGVRGVIIVVVRVDCIGERIIVRVRWVVDIIICDVVHILSLIHI